MKLEFLHHALQILDTHYNYLTQPEKLSVDFARIPARRITSTC